MLRRFSAVLTVSSVALALGCGGSSSPVTPAPIVTPAPQASATPAAPAPTPKPKPSVLPNGQTEVKRFSCHVSWIETPDGTLRADRTGPAYVGDTIRFDSDAKNSLNQPTNGSGADPVWFTGPEGPGVMLNTAGWNPKAKVLAPGQWTVFAKLDGVISDPLILTFLPAPTPAN